MQKDPITITDRAAAHIKRLMPSAISGLRIGIKKGGCAGMEYTMDIVDEPQAHDLAVVSDGARVYLAASAQMFLFGMEIDYASTLLESGFRFNNPNVAAACGCGESISFKI
ncbi:HesB/IscA family protein [Loktanella sp. DJP18]|uniref:HesB/IscA family protein n=1 Tax=Loktanella sp. DJP18 TaxID=3409788 RepID=UPI003BB665F4